MNYKIKILREDNLGTISKNKKFLVVIINLRVFLSFISTFLFNFLIITFFLTFNILIMYFPYYFSSLLHIFIIVFFIAYYFPFNLCFYLILISKNELLPYISWCTSRSLFLNCTCIFVLLST